MAENLTASGNTDYELRITNLGIVKELWDEDYDNELDTCFFEIELFNGDFYKIGLKGKTIREILLYHNKCVAEKKYVDFILKNR